MSHKPIELRLPDILGGGTNSSGLSHTLSCDPSYLRRQAPDLSSRVMLTVGNHNIDLPPVMKGLVSLFELVREQRVRELDTTAALQRLASPIFSQGHRQVIARILLNSLGRVFICV